MKVDSNRHNRESQGYQEAVSTFHYIAPLLVIEDYEDLTITLITIFTYCKNVLPDLNDFNVLKKIESHEYYKAHQSFNEH